VNEQLARRLVADRLPDRTLASLERVPDGNRKWTGIARFTETPPAVVQLAPDPEAARTAGRLLRAVADSTAVPVPAVHAAGAREDTGYLLTEHRQGRSLHERFADLPAATRRDLVRQFGRTLARLHAAFTFDGYGPLVAGEGTAGLTPAATDWETWFRQYADRAIERLPPAFDPLRKRLRRCLDAHDPAADPPGRLFPWDLRPGNALAADGEVTALVDWERPLAAVPAVSVAKTEYLVADWYVNDPAPLREAFRAGYAEERPLPTVRPAHRVAAVADTAVDSDGRVTTPGYPERDRAAAVAFHRLALEHALTG